jgi:peptide/nickel transport system substrate-binding protein
MPQNQNRAEGIQAMIQVLDRTLTRRHLGRYAAAAAGVAALAPATRALALQTQGKGGTLTYARQGEADTLDPLHAFNGLALDPLYCIFDTLTAVGPDQNVEGVLAESWDISPDGLEYTFHLRQGVAFHDGTPFNADAVKFHFDRVIDPKNTTADVSWLGPLKAITVVDENTVKFVLGSPFSPLLGNLASGYFGLPSPAASQKLGDDFGHNPVGTGRFKFKEWVTSEHISLVPNPDYKNPRSFSTNKGAPLLDALVFSVIPQADTQLAALETGQVNMITPPRREVKRLQDDTSYQVYVSNASTGLWYLEFAMLDVPQGQFGKKWKPPFDDLRMRQAVAYAINVDELIATVMEGLATRNYGPMPTGLFAYKPEIEQFGYHYDLDKAKALIAEAGWVADSDGVLEKGGTKLDLVLWSWQDNPNEKIVQIIQNELGQLGFRVKTLLQDVATWIAGLPNNAWDLDVCGWGQTEPDMLRGMTNSSWGFGWYRDEQYQQLVTQALQTTDRTKRTELYFEAAKQALADAAIVPFFSPLDVLAVRAGVKGVTWGQQDEAVYEDIYVGE